MFVLQQVRWVGEYRCERREGKLRSAFAFVVPFWSWGGNVSDVARGRFVVSREGVITQEAIVADGSTLRRSVALFIVVVG